MAWNTRTNLRALETTTMLVVEICHQMEGWRRLLRHVERIERESDAAQLPVVSGYTKATPAAVALRNGRGQRPELYRYRPDSPGRRHRRTAEDAPRRLRPAGPK